MYVECVFNLGVYCLNEKIVICFELDVNLDVWFFGGWIVMFFVFVSL